MVLASEQIKKLKLYLVFLKSKIVNLPMNKGHYKYYKY